MEKKTSCLLCVLTALLLTVLYLWAALRPGVWLRDAFLYRCLLYTSDAADE